MVNDTTVNIISDALIFRFALGILLGSYFEFWFVLLRRFLDLKLLRVPLLMDAGSGVTSCASL